MIVEQRLISLSRDAASKALLLMKDLKGSGNFNGGNQIQRSAFSVASNIAEGVGRMANAGSKRARTQFFRIAYASLKECTTQLGLLRDLDHGNTGKISEVIEVFSDLDRELGDALGVIDPESVEGIEWERYYFHDCSCGKGKASAYVYFEGTFMISPCNSCMRTEVRLSAAPMTAELLQKLVMAGSVMEQVTLLLTAKRNEV